MAYNRIDALIEALGGRQRVADEFNMTPQNVSAWISNNRIPREREIEMLMLLMRLEALGQGRFHWRPEGWDPHVELRYNPEAKKRAA